MFYEQTDVGELNHQVSSIKYIAVVPVPTVGYLFASSELSKQPISELSHFQERYSLLSQRKHEGIHSKFHSPSISICGG